MAAADQAALAIVQQAQPRRERDWGAPIAHGLLLGFRRTEFGGTWIARLHDEDKRHRYHSIVVLSADLDYEAARSAELAWSRRVDAPAKAANRQACMRQGTSKMRCPIGRQPAPI